MIVACKKDRWIFKNAQRVKTKESALLSSHWNRLKYLQHAFCTDFRVGFVGRPFLLSLQENTDDRVESIDW